MKKRILLFGFLPVVLGCAAAWLRAQELLYVYDPVTGLPGNPMWVTSVLIALSAAAFVAYTISAYCMKRLHPPAPRGKLFPIAGVLSALVLFAFSGYLVWDYLMTHAITELVLCLLTVLAAIGILLLGVKRMDYLPNNIYSLFAVIPVFWACYALILVFREWISKPIISRYIYLIFAMICILLFCYAQCGYIFRRGRYRLAFVVGSMGTYFAVIELVSPLIASLLSHNPIQYPISLSEAAPLVAFLIYFPFALCEILRNRNPDSGQ